MQDAKCTSMFTEEYRREREITPLKDIYFHGKVNLKKHLNQKINFKDSEIYKGSCRYLPRNLYTYIDICVYTYLYQLKILRLVLDFYILKNV